MLSNRQLQIFSLPVSSRPETVGRLEDYKAVQGLFDVSIFTGKPHIRERIE
jgi:hypothetical protein